MRSIHALVITFALIAGAAGSAAAQDPAKRSSRPDGVWGTIGFGLATLKVNYEGAEDTPHREAASIAGAIGWTLTPSVLMGVGVSADSDVVDDRRQTTTGFEGFVRWYPGAPPVFLRFGFGLASARVRIMTPGEDTLTVRRGVGLDFGIGWDIRLSSHVSLTPDATWRLLSIGDIPINGVNYRNVSLNNWLIGAGLTIH